MNTVTENYVLDVQGLSFSYGSTPVQIGRAHV